MLKSRRVKRRCTGFKDIERLVLPQHHTVSDLVYTPWSYDMKSEVTSKAKLTGFRVATESSNPASSYWRITKQHSQIIPLLKPKLWSLRWFLHSRLLCSSLLLRKQRRVPADTHTSLPVNNNNSNNKTEQFKTKKWHISDGLVSMRLKQRIADSHKLCMDSLPQSSVLCCTWCIQRLDWGDHCEGRTGQGSHFTYQQYFFIWHFWYYIWIFVSHPLHPWLLKSWAQSTSCCSDWIITNVGHRGHYDGSQWLMYNLSICDILFIYLFILIQYQWY